MFWTEWGQLPSIQRAGMNGNFRTAIVDSNLAWPNGMTIDYAGEMLFWIDAKLHTLSTCDFNGAGRRTIINSPSLLPHPFAISVFEDSVYWTDWERQCITKANKFTGLEREALLTNLNSPMDIQVFHPQKQPNRKSHFQCFFPPRNLHCSFNNLLRGFVCNVLTLFIVVEPLFISC